MKVNNKMLIHSLTLRIIKANRVRNIVAIIAIVLTSTLFTAIFAIGGAAITTIQNGTMRQVGTSSHARLKYLTQKQYDSVKDSPLIEDISYNILVGIAENEDLLKKQHEIRYSEDNAARWGFSYPTTGDMPRRINEIALSTIALDMLGLPYELGQQIPLEFTAENVKHSEEFTLVGFWEGDPIMTAEPIFLSREYVDSVISISEIPFYNELSEFHIEGTITADIWFSNSFQIADKVQTLLESCGYEEGEIQYGVNWAYAFGGINDPTTIAILLLALFLILLSGYLIIYSVFSISVRGDIRLYGLLKTIGTTSHQLKRIVRSQALLLSMIGIPFGLLLGYLLGYTLSPVILSMTVYDGHIVTTANPLIFIFSAVFALFTIFISLRKPCKIAAKVSPIEAIRYIVVNAIRRKKKTSHKVSPITIAAANVFRTPTKMIIVVISLSLSLILLNSTYSIINGFDMEKYLSNHIVSDFIVSDYAFFSPGILLESSETGVDTTALSEIQKIDGLESLSNIYFQDNFFIVSPDKQQRLLEIVNLIEPAIVKERPYYVQDFEDRKEGNPLFGSLALHIYGIGQMTADLITDSTIDYQKLSSGNYIYISEDISIFYTEAVEIAGQIRQDITLYHIGDTITLTNDQGEERDFEILGTATMPSALNCQYYSNLYHEVILAENVYLDFFGNKPSMLSIFNVEDEKIADAEAWINNYTSTVNATLDYRSREIYIEEYNSLIYIFSLTGGILSFILALIGILNFINSIFTSINARRQELAMLQSVGMTGQQLNHMLYFEGIWYALITFLFTVTVGALISSLITQTLAGEMLFFTMNLSILPTLITIPIFLIICIAVPSICYSIMKKESVVERLRHE